MTFVPPVRTTLESLDDVTANGGKVPISQGGTNATTASAARTALGVPAIGHTHDDRYYTESEVDTLLGAISGGGEHTHPMSDVVGLSAALDAKSDDGHTHPQSDITGLVAALDTKSDDGHTHPQSDVTGLVADLAGKASSSHTHVASDITDFASAVTAVGAGVTDHGALTGLGDDDHPQYLNAARLASDASIIHASGAETITGTKTIDTSSSLMFGTDVQLIRSTTRIFQIKEPINGRGIQFTEPSSAANPLVIERLGASASGSIAIQIQGSSTAGSTGVQVVAQNTTGPAFQVRGSSVSQTGVLVSLSGFSSTSAGRDMGAVDAIWTVSTDASRLADLVLSTSGFNGYHEAVRFKDTGTISQVVFPLANIRNAADDAAAAALTPAVPVGGLYRTGSALKIRIA